MLHLHYGKKIFSFAWLSILYFSARRPRKEVLKPWFQRAFLHTFVALDKSMPSETGQALNFAESLVSVSAIFLFNIAENEKQPTGKTPGGCLQKANNIVGRTIKDVADFFQRKHRDIFVLF